MRDVRIMWMVSLGLACSSPKSSAERSDSSASLPTDTAVSCIPRSMRDECNGRDDDCDGEVDEDPEYTWWEDLDGDGFGAGEPVAACTPPTRHSVQVDGDCDDSTAARAPDVREALDLCSDGLDNDCDLATDCDDYDDCESAAYCSETCDDGLDNDGDGLVDCEDPDCRGLRACNEDCDDGIDNDLDGRTDCDDVDCEREEPCYENCYDGRDNDLDGLVDCEDGDCADERICTEDCSDDLDNDLDGLADCDDDDCWYDADCTGALITAGTLVSSSRRWTFRKSSIRGGGTDAGTYIKVGTRTSWNTSGFVSGRQRVITDSGGVVDCTFVGRSFHINTAVHSSTMLWDGHASRMSSTSFWDYGSIHMGSANLSSGCPVSFASSFTAPVMGLAAWGSVFREYVFWEVFFRNYMSASSTGVVTSMGPTSSLEYWEETANVREHGVVTPGSWFVPH